MQITFRVQPKHIFSVNNNMELKLAGQWFDVEPHAIKGQSTRFYATAVAESKTAAQAIKVALHNTGVETVVLSEVA